MRACVPYAAAMRDARGWVLPVWKPRGIRSRQVVTWVCKVLGTRRCGHAGTLDGPAEGLVLVLVEDATRLEALFMECPKEYEAVVDFGIETESLDQTRDLEGAADVRLLRRSRLPSAPDRASLVAMLAGLCREYAQLPPRISALKIEGKRAHVLARGGADMRLDPRDVALYAVRLRALAPRGCALRVRCGKGFYMRSLGRDVAVSLETAGSLASLRRSRLGPLGRAQAVPPSLVRRDPKTLTPRDLAPWLTPMSESLVAWPALRLSPRAATRFCMGDALAAVLAFDRATERDNRSDSNPASPSEAGANRDNVVRDRDNRRWDARCPQGIPVRSEWTRVLGPRELLLGVFCGSIAAPRALTRFPTAPLLEALRGHEVLTEQSQPASPRHLSGEMDGSGAGTPLTEGPRDDRVH